jgi:hypothetical protein
MLNPTDDAFAGIVTVAGADSCVGSVTIPTVNAAAVLVLRDTVQATVGFVLTPTALAPIDRVKVGTDVSVTVTVLVTFAYPLADAMMFASRVPCTMLSFTALIGKTAELCPAAIVAVAGTVAAPGLSLESETVNALAEPPYRVIVPEDAGLPAFFANVVGFTFNARLETTSVGFVETPMSRL